MNNKEVLEIKKRFKKEECTFTKMCGCYVNSEKEILLNLNETFLNLQEEEIHKYLEIAKKALSGTIGNNLIELDFPLEEENPGGKQQFLMGLRESKLKEEGLLDTFYQLVIDNYDYAGSYLILIFHDAYDVMTKTTDNRKLDESEEVFEYLLCVMCPVDLSKPGLGYLENENRIGSRNRDKVVLAPDTGFIFPAFTDRSTDIHSTMFYTKNALEPHKEFIEFVLGCPIKATASEQKNKFQKIIHNAIDDSEMSGKIFRNIQESLNEIIEEQEAFMDSDGDSPVLTSESVQEILRDRKVPEEIAAKIETSYAENFSDEPPVIDYLIDKKILAENEKNKANKILIDQVEELQEKLKEVTKSEVSSDYDVVLHVKPEKMNQIKSQFVDGKKCIIIPMDEDEHATVNGVTDLI